jgi:hypothetical protein
MKGLILFRGLTFRGFGKSRDIDLSDHSYSNQLSATKSHVSLVKHLESQGHEIDVAFDTVECEKTYDLIRLFGSNLKYYALKNVIDLDMQFSFYRSVRSLEPIFFYVDYDFFLVVRNDLMFKENFFEMFDPSCQELKFISVLWHINRKTENNNPRVNDCVFFFPKKYFHLISSIPEPGGCDFHNILDNWNKPENKLNFNFYLDRYHDSNTHLDWNPLYKLVNRPEADKQFSDPNLKYPDDF